jgi:N-acetylglutamate synthase-like GNAT family acetyltransferase
MESHEMECIPIHLNQTYIEAAVELLEKQWPHEVAIREKRIHSMAQLSRDDLPCHLVLIQKDNKKLLGHSLLKRADGRSDGRSAVVFSVVIDPNLRGKGLGRILMQGTEVYARDHGYTHLFLSTDDQVGFYKRLGYQECEPITSLGSNSKRLTSDQVEALENLFAKRLGNSYVSVSNQTWLKKRLIEEHPIESPYPSSLLPKLILEEIVQDCEEEESGKVQCVFGLYIAVPWQQQAGPNCGIATVNMLKASLTSCPLPSVQVSSKPCDCTADSFDDPGQDSREPCVVELPDSAKSCLQAASQLRISKDGELFCSYNLSYLARVSHKLPLIVSDVGPEIVQHIALNVASGYPCLIPYDRSIGNHKPTLSEGTRAHWALISGLVVAFHPDNLPESLSSVDWSSEYKDEGRGSFCGVANVKDQVAFETLKTVIMDSIAAHPDDVYVLCIHGMSRNPFVTTCKSLLESNANLHKAKSKHFAAAKDLAHLRNKVLTIL